MFAVAINVGMSGVRPKADVARAQREVCDGPGTDIPLPQKPARLALHSRVLVGAWGDGNSYVQGGLEFVKEVEDCSHVARVTPRDFGICTVKQLR
jgi:hypothetical protein